MVRVVSDTTGEFVGYYGQLGKRKDDGTWEVDFTYNMTHLSGNRYGAYFEETELEIEHE